MNRSCCPWLMRCTAERTCKLLLLLQTMPYMPPELLAQSQLTPKADVYSFGIVMWELLSGQVSLLHPLSSPEYSL